MASWEFEAELWRWEARVEEYVLLTVPADVSDEIADLAEGVPRAGFGAVKVRVAIGGSAWSTSVFPGADGYVLPLKAAVRRREKLALGDVAQVWLEVRPVGADG